MSDPFLGEIKMVSFDFAPKGWALCNGQLLPINQNQALFSLLGTTYGGNGQTNFALPNLQGRAAAHFGQSLSLGQAGGEAAHTLIQQELPTHSHGGRLTASADFANASDPAGRVFGARPRGGPVVYAPPPADTPLAPSAMQIAGGSQPHENMQPYLTVNFVIALVGIFPSRD
jgi:microcystin-dependent protein